jgi:UDP-glucose 4-epimerase
MRVVIIGSNGFIGRHLCIHFQDNGHEVFGADVISDQVNIGKYFLINTSDSDYSIIFKNLKYDVCINCSGAASVPESITNTTLDYSLNTVNVFKILETIKKFQPECKFMNLSSAAVYGDPKFLPIKEDFIPNPLSPYGFHKLQAEYICKEFWTVFGIRTCSLRLFSVYGPWLRKQLFWDLYIKAKTGTPFSLYGTGDESRDFINVIDLGKAIELILEFSNFKADIINIANGQEIKIKDAVSVFYSFFDNAVNYSFSGYSRQGDPICWLADISKLKSFGYQPSIDLNTGLQRYLEWIIENNFN